MRVQLLSQFANLANQFCPRAHTGLFAPSPLPFVRAVRSTACHAALQARCRGGVPLARCCEPSQQPLARGVVGVDVDFGVHAAACLSSRCDAAWACRRVAGYTIAM